jgi:hypothetical protein
MSVGAADPGRRYALPWAVIFRPVGAGTSGKRGHPGLQWVSRRGFLAARRRQNPPARTPALRGLGERLRGGARRTGGKPVPRCRNAFSRPDEMNQSLVTSAATNIWLRLRRAVLWLDHSGVWFSGMAPTNGTNWHESSQQEGAPGFVMGEPPGVPGGETPPKPAGEDARATGPRRTFARGRGGSGILD